MKAWITRDIDGTLFVNTVAKPEKFKNDGIWCANNCEEDYLRIPDSCLQEGVNPQWSDDEPIEVELTISKKL